MKRILVTFIVLFAVSFVHAQHVGIVRKNYFTTYYDSLLNENIDVFDSATIRLGSIDPITGVVTNLGNIQYNTGINLNGATLDPYLNAYYISSGFNLLTFDIGTGNIINTVPITGALQTGAFQNYRFNPSDSVIYGLVPNNFYSMYYDSLSMTYIQVLDSSHIRFGSIDPSTGQYTLIGNTPYKNVYTLAGNSIDPHQMVYYYSAVDTLVAIDLYTGGLFSQVGIQLPPYAIFENFTYSCVDTSIYGLTRQNFISSVYDSLLMDYIDVIDSVTFRLSKIDPNTGLVTFISPYNIAIGATLTGGCFIDPTSMIYYFSSGNEIVGVSLTTGLVVSSVPKVLPSGAIAFDMMRSTQNCMGASKVRENVPATILQNASVISASLQLTPNPAQQVLNIITSEPYEQIELLDMAGRSVMTTTDKTLAISALADGIYFVRVQTTNGQVLLGKFVKN